MLMKTHKETISPSHFCTRKISHSCESAIEHAQCTLILAEAQFLTGNILWRSPVLSTGTRAALALGFGLRFGVCLSLSLSLVGFVNQGVNRRDLTRGNWGGHYGSRNRSATFSGVGSVWTGCSLRRRCGRRRRNGWRRSESWIDLKPGRRLWLALLGHRRRRSVAARLIRLRDGWWRLALSIWGWMHVTGLGH